VKFFIIHIPDFPKVTKKIKLDKSCLVVGTVCLGLGLVVGRRVVVVVVVVVVDTLLFALLLVGCRLMFVVAVVGCNPHIALAVVALVGCILHIVLAVDSSLRSLMHTPIDRTLRFGSFVSVCLHIALAVVAVVVRRLVELVVVDRLLPGVGLWGLLFGFVVLAGPVVERTRLLELPLELLFGFVGLWGLLWGLLFGFVVLAGPVVERKRLRSEHLLELQPEHRFEFAEDT